VSRAASWEEEEGGEAVGQAGAHANGIPPTLPPPPPPLAAGVWDRQSPSETDPAPGAARGAAARHPIAPHPSPPSSL